MTKLSEKPATKLERLLEQVHAVERDPEDQWSQSDLSDLSDQAEALTLTLADAAVEAAQDALDPKLDRHAAREARLSAEDASHDVRRAQSASERLYSALSLRQEAAAAKRRVERYEAAKLSASECAERITKDYAKMRDALVALLSEIAAVNVRIDKVNDDLPEGAAPLTRPEGLAGGFPDNGNYDLPRSYDEFRIVQAILPKAPGSAEIAWPRNVSPGNSFRGGNHSFFTVREIMSGCKK